MSGMRILPSGSRGLLLEVDRPEDVLGWYAALQAADLPVLDLVPGGRTVLVVADRDTDMTALAVAVRQVRPEPASATDRPPLEVPVDYRGEDLHHVAAALGCSAEEVVHRHQAETWTVAFCGFAPGFGYLTGARFDWSVPRRDTPRTRVPARSVALAGEFSAVYPRESPGGWQLIGCARLDVLDLDRDPPGLLTPGMRVRFVEGP